MNNYYSLLNIKYRNSTFIVVIFLIIIILILLLTVLETYDTWKTLGVNKDGKITTSIPIENSDAVTGGEYIVIDNQNYQYKVLEISEFLVDNYINYQNYVIKVDDVLFKENEVIEMTFYYNKQKIIQKIIDIIF